MADTAMSAFEIVVQQRFQVRQSTEWTRNSVWVGIGREAVDDGAAAERDDNQVGDYGTGACYCRLPSLFGVAVAAVSGTAAG